MTMKNADDSSSTGTAPSTTPKRNRSLMVGESNSEGISCHVEDEVILTLEAPEPANAKEVHDNDDTENPKSRDFVDNMHTTNGSSISYSQSHPGKNIHHFDDHDGNDKKSDNRTWWTRDRKSVV